MIVALDTSVLVGLLDARDVWHSAALCLHDTLIATSLALVYCDCTLAAPPIAPGGWHGWIAARG